MSKTRNYSRTGMSPEDVCRGNLLRSVSVALRRANRKLCVLHGYENYPERIDSDLDCVCPEPAQIPRLLHERGVFAVVQAIEHERNAFYYVLHRDYNGKPVFVALDVSADYRRNGRVFFGSAEFSESRRSFEDFDVPAVELEFACYLVKKIVKGRLDRDHAEQLISLYGEDPAGCRRQLERLFPERENLLIMTAARSGDWERVRTQIENLRATMLRKIRRRNRRTVIRYWIDDLRRRVERVLRPTGLAVAFMGPDGSGKSTIMDRVEKDLAPAFRRSTQYRLRPGLPKGGISKPVTEPHALPPWGTVLSLVKLALWWVDYTLGYVFRVYPRLVCSTFVLFDRYYHDLLVDPVRYRYGAPLWLARVAGPLLPRPQLVIVLDAPVEVLRARKQEISSEELSRQREAYLKVVRGLPNGHTVDASRPLEEVLAEVEKLILGYMAGRTARRLKVDRRTR